MLWLRSRRSVAVLTVAVLCLLASKTSSDVTTRVCVTLHQNSDQNRSDTACVDEREDVCQHAYFACSVDEALAMTANATGDVDIVLLEGAHVLSKSVVISGVSRLTLSGLGCYASNVDITEKEGGFRIINATAVTLSGLSLSVGESLQAIEVVTSRHVTFKDVLFYDILGYSQAVRVNNSDQVSFYNCSFEGPSYAVEENNTRIGVAVSFDNFHPCEHCSRASDQENLSTVSLVNCSFRQFLSAEPSYLLLLQTAVSDARATAMTVRFSGRETRGVTVRLQHCVFEHIQMELSSTAHITFTDEASDNTVEVVDSQFTDCFARYGGASLIDFSGRAINNTVRFTRVTFRSLNVTLQGGAASIQFINANKNFVFFIGCNFFHLSGRITAVGSLLAGYSNRRSGVPVSIDANTDHQIVIDSANVDNNTARDGIIYGKGITMLLTGNSYFTRSSDGIVILYGSYLTLRGSQSFVSNRASNGGAISLYDESTIDVSKIDKLVMYNNTALRSGGAIYSDLSNGQPFVEWINRRIGVAVPEQCFLNFENNTFDFVFGSNSTKIQIYGNRANENGLDVCAPSFSRCSSFFSSCKVLSSIIHERLVSADSRLHYAFSLVNARPQYHDQTNCSSVVSSLFTVPVHAQAASSIYWLFFESASCSCLKPIAADGYRGLYWEFRDQCNATQISTYSLNRFPVLYNASSIFKRKRPSVHVTYQFPLPPEEMFYVPWSHAWLSRFLKRANDLEVIDAVLMTSNVTLTPSPGEQFQLHLRAFDQFLRAVNGTVAYMSLTPPVEGLQESLPVAVLRRGHTQYERSGSVVFLVNEPIFDVSLLGPVNATGKLWISAQSVFPDDSIILSIPFRLVPCHLGYTMEPVDFTEAEAYILGNGPDNKAFVDSLLSCHGIDSDAISSSSPSGRSVSIKTGTWAGDINAELDYFTQPNPRNGTIEELLAPAFRRHFGWGSCVLDFCADEAMHHNWSLTETDPCTKGRTGRLCGTCQPGLTITPSNLDCVDCTGVWGSVGIFVTILVSLVATILLLLLAIFTDISKSTTYDTLLFVFQVIPYLVPVGSTSSFVTGRFTFSFMTGLCFSDSFQTTAYFTFQILAPTFFLAFILLLVTTNPRPVRRLLTLPRTLKAVVFVLIITYFTFAAAGMELLRANRLHTEHDPSGNLVVFINGTSAYTSARHVGFVPVGAFIIVAVAVLPLLAVVYRDHPRVKPLSDVYTSFYNDKHRWWIAVSLWRRFVLALLAIGVSMAPIRDVSFVRQNTLFASVLILTVLHLIFQPFRTNFANRFETIVMFNLCLLSGLSIATVGVVPIEVMLLVLYWPFAAGLFIFLYDYRYKIWRLCLTIWFKCRRTRSNEIAGEREITGEKEMDGMDTISAEADKCTTT